MNNIFLASSLCMVDDIITKEVNLNGKKIGCIRNAAKERGGKDARRNKRDIDFLSASGSILIDVDLEQNIHREELRTSIDILFVGGGDTLYLRDLAEQSGLQASIYSFLQQGGMYMGTSAGSMLACNEVYYPHKTRKTNGLGLFPLCIIPHRGSPLFFEDRENDIKQMNNHGQSYIMLTDIDVIIIGQKSRSVQRSQKHTLEEVFQKVNSME